MSVTASYRVTSEFYDYVVPYRDLKDTNFYVEKAIQAAGPTLELGSGTGRVLLPVARAGVSVTGLEPSPDMLAVCRGKLEREPSEVRQRVTLMQGEMQNFEFGRSFSLIYAPFRVLQHLLTVEHQLKALETVRRHLTPTGRFVFDVFDPFLPMLYEERFLKEETAEPEFSLPDGRRVVRLWRHIGRDYGHQTLRFRLAHEITYPDGNRERLEEDFEIRYFFRYELEHLLVRTGFEVDAVHGDFDGSPVGSKPQGQLVFVTRRV